jgi:diaminopimelate epimerase
MKYHKINPGGNTTALVKGTYTKKQQLKINTMIMKSDSSIEQVGFWRSSKNPKLDGCLEMAGGEFCGNALRAFGVVLSATIKKNTFAVKSSGTKELIKITATTTRSSIALSTRHFELVGGRCSLPGISYVFSDRNVNRNQTRKILEASKMLTLPAAGMIKYLQQNTNFFIRPIVWVRDTKTFIEETACGSGTLALAYREFVTSGIKKLHVTQPSGAIFETKIAPGRIFLTGPIFSIEEKEIVSKQ